MLLKSQRKYLLLNVMTATDVHNLQRAFTGIGPVRAYLYKKVIKSLDTQVVPEFTKLYCPQEKVPGLAIFDKKK